MNNWLMLWIGLCAVLAWGTLLRLFHLGQPSLWMDEATAFVHAKAVLAHGFPLLPTGVFSWEAIPFHYVLALPLALGIDMHWALRLWPAIAGILAIFIAFQVGRKITSSVVSGLVAAILMAFLDFQIEWSRQGKVYTVLQCLLLGAAWLVLDRRSMTFGRGALAVLLALVAVAIHRAGYLAFLIIGLDMAFRLWDSFRRGESKTGIAWVALALGAVGFVLAFKYHGPSGLRQTLAALRHAPESHYCLPYASYLYRQMGGLLILGFAGAICLVTRQIRTGGLLVAASAAYGLAICFGSHLFAYRYLLPVMPFVCIYVAVPFSWLDRASHPSWSSRKSVLVGLFICSLALWGGLGARLTFWPSMSPEVDDTVPRPDWRKAAELIRGREMQGEIGVQSRLAVASSLPTVMDAYFGDMGVEKFYLPINMTGYPGEDLWVSYYAKADVIQNVEQLQHLKGYLLMDDFSLQSLLDPALKAALGDWPPDAIIAGDFPVYIWILDGLPKLGKTSPQSVGLHGAE